VQRYAQSGGLKVITPAGESNAVILPIKPAPPLEMWAEAMSPTVIRLRWIEQYGGNKKDGFKIERSLDGKTYIPIATVGLVGQYYDDNNSAGLTPATRYYYRLRAYNSAGNSAYVFASALTQSISDSTPPTTPVVTDQGTYTTNTRQLWVSISSSDPESGIVEYQYAVLEGSISGTIIKPWTSLGNRVNILLASGLSLGEGKRYFIGVKTRNGAGMWSSPGYSDGVTVDSQPPSLKQVSARRDPVRNIATISASVSDTGSGVGKVTLYYRPWIYRNKLWVIGGYQAITMLNQGAQFSQSISLSKGSPDGGRYFIIAQDKARKLNSTPLYTISRDNLPVKSSPLFKKITGSVKRRTVASCPGKNPICRR
jgi:titin